MEGQAEIAGQRSKPTQPMTDIEGRPLVENPYISGSNENNNLARKTSLLIQRFVYMGLSLYGLNHFNVYQVILHSPHVSHEWFKVGLAATIGAYLLNSAF